MRINKMRNVAKKVAHQLCDCLNKKGMKTESDFVLRPIDRTLRQSWYVDKVKQCGHTDCIHINISDDDFCNAFFAILENGEIMTGGNCMILDAFAALDSTQEAGEFIISRPHLYKVFERDDDVCIITSLNGIKSFINRYENED